MWDRAEWRARLFASPAPSSSREKLASPTDGLVALVAALFVAQVALDLVSYRAHVGLTYALGGALALLLVFAPRVGTLAFLVVVILSDDLSRLPGAPLHSILATPVLGLNIIVYLVPLLAASAGIRWLRGPTPALAMGRGPHFLFLAFLVPMVVGLGALSTAPRMFVHDAGYLVVPLAAYLAVRVFHGTGEGLHRVGRLLVAALCARAIWGVVAFALGEGYRGQGELTFTLSSTRDLYPIAWVLLFAFFMHREAIPVRRPALLLLLGGIVLMNIVFNISRYNVIVAGVGALAVVAGAVWQGRRAGVRRPIKPSSWVAGAAVVVAALVAVQVVSPGTLGHVAWKLGTLEHVPTSRADITASSEVRVLELVNILAWEREQGTLLFGEGFGGWYTDKAVPYAAQYIGGTAYPDEHIRAGTLYTPHDTPNFLLLKGGLFILVVLAVVIGRMTYQTLTIATASSSPVVRAWGLGLAVMLPIIALKSWSTATHIFWGVLMALAVTLQEHQLATTQASRDARQRALLGDLGASVARSAGARETRGGGR